MFLSYSRTTDHDPWFDEVLIPWFWFFVVVLNTFSQLMEEVYLVPFLLSEPRVMIRGLILLRSAKPML